MAAYATQVNWSNVGAPGTGVPDIMPIINCWNCSTETGRGVRQKTTCRGFSPTFVISQSCGPARTSDPGPWKDVSRS